MALKAMLESLDGLSEEITAEYTETDDGKFRLDVTPAGGLALEDVQGLKSTLGKLKRDVETVSGNLKAFDGLDADEARKAIEVAAEFEGFDPNEVESKAAKRFEVMKAQLVAKQAKVDAEKDATIAGQLRQIETIMIKQAATAAIAKYKGALPLLLPHVQGLTELKTGESGEYHVQVLDENGVPRIGNSNGDAMTIEQFVESLKADDTFARAFDGSGASGGGAPGNPGGPAGGGATKTVKAGDQAGLNDNLEGIADGTVKVV